MSLLSSLKMSNLKSTTAPKSTCFHAENDHCTHQKLPVRHRVVCCEERLSVLLEGNEATYECVLDSLMINYS
jgi:hypothetical protein